MTQPTGNNSLIDAIINGYFRVSEMPSNKIDGLAHDLVQLILQVFSSQFNNKNVLFNYKDITDVVFNTDKELFSDSIGNFRQKIEAEANRQSNNSEDIRDNILYCHDKMIGHILLAQAQRDFIKKSIVAAKEAAQKAEQIAKSAEKTAQKAEKIYETMFANYITILGIFAAIIISIFGGLNIIKSAVISSLEWSAIVNISSLLMICEITILYFLTKMIKVLTQKDLNIEWVFLSIITICFFVILWSEFYF